MKNIHLPKTYEELISLDLDVLHKLWLHFFKQRCTLNRPIIFKPLWYHIQCKLENVHIERSNITKLKKLANNTDKYIKLSHTTKYDLMPGAEIKKTYKQRQYHVKVISNSEFEYNETIYPTLSAIAKEISGKKFSGPDFFGLRKKPCKK